MSIFKTADKNLEKLGFQKVEETEGFVRYESTSSTRYVHVVDLVRKSSGNHIIQSYQKDAEITGVYSVMIGLPYAAAKSCVKKMWELGWTKKEIMHKVHMAKVSHFA